MPRNKDEFPKIRRVGKTRDQIAYKNVRYEDLIDDSYDEDFDSEDSYCDEEDDF